MATLPTAMQADILMQPLSTQPGVCAWSESQVVLQDSVRFTLDAQLPNAAPAEVRVRIGRSDTTYYEFPVNVLYQGESAHNFGVRAFTQACIRALGDGDFPDERLLKDSLRRTAPGAGGPCGQQSCQKRGGERGCEETPVTTRRAISTGSFAQWL